jgi:DNA invertase Pin-like site-specific DNA recombinase
VSLISYAHASTDDQATDAQADVLTAAGCAEIFREHMSGAKASQPELLKALGKIQRGDVLVVARLDRLARSLSHLLSVIAEGAHFKSFADPVDTTTPQGRFALQVLGAVAELERARSFGNAPRVACAPQRDVAASAAIPNCAPAIAKPSSA